MHREKRRLRRYLTLLICSVIIGNCWGCAKDDTARLEEMSLEESKEDSKDKPKEKPIEKEKQTIYVYVCGAVQSPGVYELEPGSRIYQAIDAAGGMTKAAEETYLNQAETMEDGASIKVPTKEEVAAMGQQEVGDAKSGNANDQGKININTAEKEELMTLTGIGEAKAESIIQYREEHGSFQSIEDMKSIPGIKDGVFQKIKEDITV